MDAGGRTNQETESRSPVYAAARNHESVKVSDGNDVGKGFSVLRCVGGTSLCHLSWSLLIVKKGLVVQTKPGFTEVRKFGLRFQRNEISTG